MFPPAIENSPNSLCEAMLLGLPIIVSYAGGTSSILNNGEEGILVQDGYPYSLAGAIIEVANNFPMAKNVRTHAEERHDKNKIVNNLINTYNSIIGN